jgi:hypothetical protein
MNEENRKVAIAFVEAMGRNDLDTVAACMAPDGELVAMGGGKFAGVHSPLMIAGSIEAMRKMLPSGLNFSIESVTSEGDRVVVEARSNADIGEAEPFRNDYVFVARMAGGKIKRCHEYFCTVLAEEKLWPLAERAGYGFD